MTKPSAPKQNVPAAKPGAAKPGNIYVSPARAQARPGSRLSQPVQAKKRRSGLRPLDIGLIVLGVVAVVAIIFVVLSNSNSSAGTPGTSANDAGPNRTPLPVNVQAPDFSLPGTDGKTYTLSQYRGQVVVLEFMAPWCPHCQEAAPIMNQVYDAYHPKNVQFLGVNATPYGHNYESGDQSAITMDDQKWFVQNFAVKYPLLFDKAVKAGADYQITGFPTVYVLDKQGVIRGTPQGGVTFDTMSQAIDGVLQLGAAPAAPVAALPARAGE